MKRKLKHWMLPCDVYGQYVVLVYDYQDTDDVNKWIERNYKGAKGPLDKSKQGCFFALHNETTGHDVYFICVGAKEKKRSKASHINTIMHECFHAAHRIMRDVGVIFSTESEEAFAYYTDDLFLACLKKVYPELKRT